MPNCDPSPSSRWNCVGVVRGGDHQDVPDPGQHQRGQRVVDHRLVVDRHELLADAEGDRVQPGAGAAGQDDSAHGVSLPRLRRPRSAPTGRSTARRAPRACSRSSGRLMPTTLCGSPSTPSTNAPPSPSMVNAPATCERLAGGDVRRRSRRRLTSAKRTAVDAAADHLPAGAGVDQRSARCAARPERPRIARQRRTASRHRPACRAPRRRARAPSRSRAPGVLGDRPPTARALRLGQPRRPARRVGLGDLRLVHPGDQHLGVTPAARSVFSRAGDADASTSLIGSAPAPAAAGRARATPRSSAARWKALRSKSAPLRGPGRPSRACSQIRSPTLYDGAWPGQPR